MTRLDLRVWVEGGQKPTKQGVSIPLAAVPVIVERLTAMLASSAADNESCDETKV